MSAEELSHACENTIDYMYGTSAVRLRGRSTGFCMGLSFVLYTHTRERPMGDEKSKIAIPNETLYYYGGP